jgi:hypothetical protein
MYQPVEFSAAKIVRLPFCAQFFYCSGDDAPNDFCGRAGRLVSHLAGVCARESGPIRSRCPLDRVIRVGQVRCAPRQACRVQPRRMCESPPDSDSLVSLILIAWVGEWLNASGCTDCRELCLPPSKEGSREAKIRVAGYARQRPHAGKAADACTPIKAHDERFRLIVEMMRGGEDRQAAFAHPRSERSVSDFACLFLKA